jgi:hypothetical protein
MAWFRSAVLAVAIAACKQHGSKLDRLDPPPPATRIALDGELDEPAWNAVAMRGVFEANGVQARPYAEIRLLRDETHVLVGLYAADEDIRSDDSFDLTAGAFVAHLTADGRATPATVRTAVDRDGTLDDPNDDDEEWVIEAAIPIAALGPAPVAMSAERCDRTKDGVKRCSSWRGSFDPKTLAQIR